MAKRGKPVAVFTSIIAVVGVLAYLLISGFGEAMVYYKTVDELLDDAGRFEGRPIRINGVLVPDSVRHRPGTDEYRFAMSKRGKQIEVQYSGVLPDSMLDGRDLVVQGTLQPKSGLFVASEILTKCPSKHEEKAQAIQP